MYHSDSTFRVLLRGGPRRSSLKMWFHALEFSVSCTVVKCFFFGRRNVLGSAGSSCSFCYSKQKKIQETERVWVPSARSTRTTSRKKKWLQSTINRKFKRLEPYFQTSATRSAPKEDTKNAIALVHSRECTKGLISGLPIFGSIEKFGAGAEKRKVFPKKTAAYVLPLNCAPGMICCREFWQ